MKDKHILLVFYFIFLALGVIAILATPTNAEKAPATPFSIEVITPSVSPPSVSTPAPQHIHLLTNQPAYILCGGSPDQVTEGQSVGTLRATSYGPDSWLIECLPPNQ